MNAKLFMATLFPQRRKGGGYSAYTLPEDVSDELGAELEEIRPRRGVRPPHCAPLRAQCARFKRRFGDSRVEQREPWRLI